MADVHKPFLSVSECAVMGFDGFLGERGGFLQDRQSSERIQPERRESIYIMVAWIRQDPEVNVSQPPAGPG